MEMKNDRAALESAAPTAVTLPVDITDDDNDVMWGMCANFGRGESHVRYALDNRGNVRLIGIWRDTSDMVSGSQMVAWLKAAYGRNIMVNEVAAGAEGFWEKMHERGLVTRWSHKPYAGETEPMPDPLPGYGALPAPAGARSKP